jgi:hypothetical protein
MYKRQCLVSLYNNANASCPVVPFTHLFIFNYCIFLFPTCFLKPCFVVVVGRDLQMKPQFITIRGNPPLIVGKPIACCCSSFPSRPMCNPLQLPRIHLHHLKLIWIRPCCCLLFHSRSTWRLAISMIDHPGRKLHCRHFTPNSFKEPPKFLEAEKPTWIFSVKTNTPQHEHPTCTIHLHLNQSGNWRHFCSSPI